ncbi:HNH endonuclease [Propionibacterium acidifaciens]|uniref:HNH endonuclease n=1 Tax=Propionibacterium acidifaciens TaxID=556499 RepID=UPI003622042D
MVTRGNTALRDRHRRIIARDRPPCAICGQPIDYDLPCWNDMSFVVDHILPLAAGGPDTIDNKQPAHRVCNRQKSDKVSGISTSQAMRMPFVRDSTFAE